MSLLRRGAQLLLGAFLILAGTAHLTVGRTAFRAQVPPWVPLDADLVVVLSGLVEIGVGAAVLLGWRQPARAVAGIVAASLFVAVFPGNIAQFTEHRDAFGLDTDAGRATRLLFQPLLVLWAIWSTEAVTWWRSRSGGRRPPGHSRQP